MSVERLTASVNGFLLSPRCQRPSKVQALLLKCMTNFATELLLELVSHHWHYKKHEEKDMILAQHIAKLGW